MMMMIMMKTSHCYNNMTIPSDSDSTANIISKMTGESLEVCSDKRKPREERERKEREEKEKKGKKDVKEMTTI